MQKEITIRENKRGTSTLIRHNSADSQNICNRQQALQYYPIRRNKLKQGEKLHSHDLSTSEDE